MKILVVLVLSISVCQSFILPGTNYCGAGERTDEEFMEKPIFLATDKCCHEHDYCPKKIPSFYEDFELYNYRPYTINLCECDAKFWQCLKNDGSFVSSQVGYWFFNMLQIPCFELKAEPNFCQKYAYYGLGSCLEFVEKQIAELKDAKYF